MSDQNNVDKLRDILFETLGDLKNKENPMDIERAKAISDVAQTIINTAKVEIDHARITGAPHTTRFIAESVAQEQQELPKGGYIHKIGQRHNN
ncbi:hypothetical protein SAMN05216302_101480 [Nitrosomonas aestuarii]|uniref:Uncharacterized protein n=1 Tax=Nitrosomonas aestuarii TaxID=52441 RepID=A0A1I4C649_9PROT|nr:hypothetical protein [Nitrosomonas aestuarii]SFK75636.1 hypothetical protein SAMN05216302_101480 [Nitrosomonas aestuarii]